MFSSNRKFLFVGNLRGKYGSCCFLLLFGHYGSFVMIWFLNKKSQTMTPYFSLFILTRLCVWLKALCLDFPYKALDTLISADGLVRWTDLKNVRPIITWSPPASHELKLMDLQLLGCSSISQGSGTIYVFSVSWA